MIKDVSQYLSDGCGRCDHFQTPKCKVNSWRDELVLLRSILLETQLKEELKWSNPCYTLDGKNIVMLAAFKDHCSLAFFKGALLEDPDGLLVFSGPNSQSSKQLRFTRLDEIQSSIGQIHDFVNQAIEVEKAGKKIQLDQVSEAIPRELELKFQQSPELKTAFESLTPGRQRGYILHFSQAKKSETRMSRIESLVPKILSGKGFHDR